MATRSVAPYSFGGGCDAVSFGGAGGWPATSVDGATDGPAIGGATGGEETTGGRTCFCGSNGMMIGWAIAAPAAHIAINARTPKRIASPS